MSKTNTQRTRRTFTLKKELATLVVSLTAQVLSIRFWHFWIDATCGVTNFNYKF
ncbi:MAG: hypothetical protein AB1567_06825 [bacterium]